MRAADLLATRLIAWYHEAKRDLPWRRTVDPYAIWVSEAMLQQTQVATALPYYDRWMRRFPDVQALAAATEDDVLAMWQGLGYYSRAKALLQGARVVARTGWPTSHAEWLQMPGVGPYTAAAVASICLGEPTAVVDGNVDRVYARVSASAETGAQRRKGARSWASTLIPHDRPADFNQALMELGATVCRPKQPRCGDCPVAQWCEAFDEGTVDRFPVANPRPPSVDTEWPVLVAVRAGQVLMERAPEGEWWAGMLRFPRLPEDWKLEPVGIARHTVTRHRVTFAVYVLSDADIACLPSASWFPVGELAALPIPSAMRKVWRVATESRLSLDLE